MEEDGGQDELRERALANLKRKRDFRTQVVTWILVSALLILIWLVTSDGDGFFWPVFPIAGWGIGIGIQGYSIYGPGSRPITEDEIRRESERLGG